MKRNHLIRFLAAAVALGLLALLAWSLLELYPRRRTVPASREARANEYLALDRWLQVMGCPVRVLRTGNLSTISGAPERHIFIQSSRFNWTPAAAAHLVRWVEEGGSLFLVLDYQADWEFLSSAALLSLLDEFGIEARRGTLTGFRHNSDAPTFWREFSFAILRNRDALAVEDWNGIIRLVQVERGAGRIIVSGKPRFLHSQFLGRAPNARLAWTLFAAGLADHDAHGSGRGWLFIRGTARTQGLWGSLFRHGNLGVIGVSALVLLAVGFWAVIPMFGLVRRDGERPGKPLRERFIAEGRFLKTYGALGFYRDVYVKEIRRRLARKEGISDDDAVIEHVLNALNRAGNDKEGQMKEGQLFISAIRKEPITYREFPKMISIFRTILERI